MYGYIDHRNHRLVGPFDSEQQAHDHAMDLCGLRADDYNVYDMFVTTPARASAAAPEGSFAHFVSLGQ